MIDRKVHFKLYKAGKKWLVAAIGVATLTVGAQQTAHAATAESSDESQTNQVQPEQATQSANQVTLKTAAKTTTTQDDSDSQQTASQSSQTSVASQTEMKANSEGTTSRSAVDSNRDASQTQRTTTATPKVQTATVQDASQASKQAAQTATATAPAITMSSDAQEPSEQVAVEATAKLTATNDAGTVTSTKSTKDGTNVIVDADATNLQATYTLTNNTDEVQGNVKTVFTLPLYAETDNKNIKSQTALSDDVDEATFTTGLPDGLKIYYIAADGSAFAPQTLAQLKASHPDFKWSELKAFQVIGELAPHESLTWTLPLVPVTKDLTDTTNAESVGTLGWWGASKDGSVKFRYATPIQLSGQYRVVTETKAPTATTAAEYQALPAAIQAQMPTVDPADLTITNIVNGKSMTTTGDFLYFGGSVRVDLTKTTLATTLAKYGYTLSIVNGGWIDNNPTSTWSALTPVVTGDTTDVSQYAPVIYVVARKVLTVQDTNVEAGSNWQSADNLVTAIGNDDQPLDASAIQVSVTDPDGVLKDGKIVKNGQFTVTYTVRAGNPSTLITLHQTATVTADGAYTVNLINQRGHLATSLAVYRQDGTTQTVALPTGFTLLNSDATSITVTLNGDETTPITVAVNQTPVAYTVNYVNAQGQTVGHLATTGLAADQVNVNADVPAGYQLADTTANTVVLTATPDVPITVAVVPAPLTYQVNFTDQNGKVVGTTSIAGINGARVDVANDVPSGYTLVPGMMSNLTLTPVNSAPIQVQVMPTGSTVPLADATAPVPAITNDTGTTLNNQDKVVQSTAQLQATNAQGTSISQSSNYAQAGAIVDVDATNLAAVYHLANQSDESQNLSMVLFILPKYMAAATSQIDVSDQMTEADFEKDLPTGLQVTYAVHGGEYLSYVDLLKKYPDFKWSDLLEFKVTGQLAAHEAYTWTVPLTVVSADTVSLSGVSKISVLDYADSQVSTGTLPFRLAKVNPLDMQGAYKAVTQIQSNVHYVQVPADIRALMPEIQTGDVSYHNFYREGGTGNSHVYSGGGVVVDLVHAGIADAVKDHGYSLLLNADGTPQTVYSYWDQGAGKSVQVDSSADADGTTDYAPYIYMTLRQVVATHDSTLHVGDTWQRYANLDQVLNNQDAALTAGQYADLVGVQINDPNHVLQDGQAKQSGTFTVTYSYQVADDYNGTGQPYVISNTATVTVNADYQVNFVDPGVPTSIVKTATLADQLAGTTVDVINLVPKGYVLATGQDPVVTLTADASQPLAFNVVKAAKTYQITYQTADGTPVATVTGSGQLGEQVDLNASVPSDYDLVDPTDATVTLGEASHQSFTVTVTRQQHDYVVNFVTANGQTVKSMTVSGLIGATVDVSTAVPTGYQLTAGANAELTLPENVDQPLTVVVEQPAPEPDPDPTPMPGPEPTPAPTPTPSPAPQPQPTVEQRDDQVQTAPAVQRVAATSRQPQPTTTAASAVKATIAADDKTVAQPQRASAKPAAAATTATKLPQTDEQATASMISLGLTGLIGLLGLAGWQRKQRHN